MTRVRAADGIDPVLCFQCSKEFIPTEHGSDVCSITCLRAYVISCGVKRTTKEGQDASTDCKACGRRVHGAISGYCPSCHDSLTEMVDDSAYSYAEYDDLYEDDHEDYEDGGEA
jgi:hypothetical protein